MKENCNINTPFLPPDILASILEEAKSHRNIGEGKCKGKRKDKEVIIIKAVAPNLRLY